MCRSSLSGTRDSYTTFRGSWLCLMRRTRPSPRSRLYCAGGDGTPRGDLDLCPRQDSNLRTRLRRERTSTTDQAPDQVGWGTGLGPLAECRRVFGERQAKIALGSRRWHPDGVGGGDTAGLGLRLVRSE